MPEEENKEGGLSTTPEQQAFNSDALADHKGFASLDEYIRSGQERGVIPANLTESQRKEIEAAYNEVKSQNT